MIKFIFLGLPASFSKTFNTTNHVRSWPPRMALMVQSEQGLVHERFCKEALSASLHDCGFLLVDADSSPLLSNVMLTQSTNNAAWKLRWEIGWSDVSSPTKPCLIDIVHRDFMDSDADLFSLEELGRLGVMMAQDALRLWSTPITHLESPTNSILKSHHEQ